MGKILTDSQHYNDIANAIRNKGVSGQFKPGQMASAISQIETGADVSGVTAVASDVRLGKKFVDSDGKTVTGSVVERDSDGISFASIGGGRRAAIVEPGIYRRSVSKVAPTYVRTLTITNASQVIVNSQYDGRDGFFVILSGFVEENIISFSGSFLVGTKMFTFFNFHVIQVCCVYSDNKEISELYYFFEDEGEYRIFVPYSTYMSGEITDVIINVEY